MKLEKNPIILVANKADMVRNRKVKSSLGKELATANNIKYIETSSGKFCAIITFSSLIIGEWKMWINDLDYAGINHNIDELLVGIYTQIQLRQKTEGHVRKSSLTNKVDNLSVAKVTQELPLSVIQLVHEMPLCAQFKKTLIYYFINN